MKRKNFRSQITCLSLIVFLIFFSCDEEIPKIDLPTPPINIRAELRHNGIELTWDGNAENYAVYRSATVDGKFAKIATTTKTFFVDLSVIPDQIYFYKISAIDDNNLESDLSDLVTIKFIVAILDVDQRLINFNEIVTTQKLKIQNLGNATLEWEISISTEWLSIQPESGEIIGRGEEVLIVTADPELPPGEYETVIELISKSGESISVRAVMRIAVEPIFTLNPEMIDFGPTAEQIEMIVSNSGTGEIEWSIISGDLNWLAISTKSGTISTKPQSVHFSVDRTQLETGSHTAEIVFATNTGERRKVNATIEIVQPILDLSISELNFGTDSELQFFEIRNSSNGVIDWRAEVDHDWAIIVPSSARIGNRESIRAYVRIFRDRLSAGDHRSEIHFDGNSGVTDLLIKLKQIGKIEGIVRDVDHRPIESATVQLIDSPNTTVETDRKGSFIIPFENDGDQNLSISADGYFDRSEKVTTHLAKATFSTELSRLPKMVAGRKLPSNSSEAIRVAFDRDRAYFTSELDNRIFVIENDSQISEIALSCSAHDCRRVGITTHPFLPKLYVAISGTDQIAIIDTISQTEIDKFTVGDYPVDCVVSQNGKTLYTVLQRENAIAVVDLSIPTRTHRIFVGDQPDRIVISPSGDRLFVSNNRENKISVIDIKTQSEVRKIAVGRGPTEIAIAENGDYLYVLNSLSEDLSIIDLKSEREIVRPKVGRSPISIAVKKEPNRRELVFVLERDGVINVVEMPMRGFYREIEMKGTDQSKQISYDHHNEKFFILNASDQNIFIFR